jgi:NitT/TauT family transport system permease protein
MREKPRRVRLGQAAVLLGLLAAWEGLSRKAGGLFLPGPGAAVSTVADGVQGGWLLPHLATTVVELGWAYVWAVAIGLSLGFGLGTRPVLREAYEDLLLNLYAVPKVTLFPLFLASFKLGMASKVAFGAFHGLFPVAIYTWTAIRTMNPVHLKVARSLKLSSWETFWRVLFPAVLPGIVTGLRLGFNLTLLGVVLGEMFASRGGLGFLLMSFAGAFDATRIVAVIVVLFVMALGANGMLLALERRIRRGPEGYLQVS